MISHSISPARMFLRRSLFFSLVIATSLGLIILFARMLSVDGFGFLDALMTLLYAINIPWSAIGVWTALIGFIVMRTSKDAPGAVMPAYRAVRGNEPISASTAILMCIRNEAPERVLRNVRLIMEGLITTGSADRFHLYLLSDTNLPDIAAMEDRESADLIAEFQGRFAITYRRRTSNEGFKAGNLWDWFTKQGPSHEFAITLDADSFMEPSAILRLVRTMQADEKLGILQSLVVGLPSTSAFARIFQFGMRLGMRSWTIGSAWWQGDCGPYWGHNAILRIKPFVEHCKLGPIPGEGPLRGQILSHDQIEAVLMRKAGYDVRALPIEEGSYEENPPSMIEFLRRDMRWCTGNMQYIHLLGMPGIRPISRYQILFAIWMFVGSPAAALHALIIGLRVAFSEDPGSLFDHSLALWLLAAYIVMFLAPKLATLFDVLSTPALRAGFGGTKRILQSVGLETAFSFLLTPIMGFGHNICLAGLVLGRSVGWSAQNRDDHAVPFSFALRALWLHQLAGIFAFAWMAIFWPAALPWMVLLIGGLLVCIPFAMITASQNTGAWLARKRLVALPEETAPSDILRRLQVPAIDLAQQGAAQ
jgi:membrane glycosyltransferase